MTRRINPMELTSWLCAEAGDRTVALDGKKAISEKEFKRRVQAWRRTFLLRGIRRAAVFSENSCFFAEVLFGAWAAGTVALLLSDLRERTLREHESCADCLVCDEECPTAPWPGIAAPDPGETEEPMPVLDAEAPLAELSTSGSTGRPVRIVKHLRQLFERLDELDGSFPQAAPAGAVVYSSVPPQHIYGLLWRVLWPLATGRIITSERLLYPETIRERIAGSEGAIFVTSPAVLKRMPEDEGWQEVRRSLAMIVSSGGPLSESALFKTQRIFGQTPYEILGSTELDGIAWRHRRVVVRNGQEAAEPASTRWRPMPGVQIKAEDDGVMSVSSLRLPTLDWTRGSDVIEVNADGTFALKKRVDRIVKIEEKRVNLDAMEALLKETGFCSETRVYLSETLSGPAAVIVPNAEGREILASEGKLALVRRLRSALLRGFEPVVIPSHWRFEPAMPADERGKLSVAVLDALFDPRRPQPISWKREGNTAEWTVKVTAGVPFFKGHFSGFPIFPGIGQVWWAQDLAERFLGVPASVSGIRNLKFSKLLRPEETVRIVEVSDLIRGCIDFRIVGAADGSLYSSGRLQLASGDSER